MEKSKDSLKQKLIVALEKYNGKAEYLGGKLDYQLVGRQCDILLAELKNRIIENPSLENIATFVNSLDKFYSSGLKFIPEAVLQVSIYIKDNWKSKFCEIAIDKSVKVEHNLKVVELIRKDIAKLLKPFNRNKSKKKVDQFSFVTKLFHQLNNSFPIWDENVRLFFHAYYPEKFKHHLKYSYPDYYLIVSDIAINEIGWSMSDYNNLDNAIWVMGDEIKRLKRKKRKTK